VSLLWIVAADGERDGIVPLAVSGQYGGVSGLDVVGRGQGVDGRGVPDEQVADLEFLVPDGGVEPSGRSGGECRRGSRVAALAVR
jgi:hypothetical protein